MAAFHRSSGVISRKRRLCRATTSLTPSTLHREKRACQRRFPSPPSALPAKLARQLGERADGDGLDADVVPHYGRPGGVLPMVG